MAYQAVPMPLWSIHSVRLQLLSLLASVLCVVSAGRSALSISLLCIVSDPVSNGSANCHEPLDLPWSLRQQSWVHTAYYIGGMISVFTSSIFINRFGPKNIISVTLMTTAAGAFCTPLIILFRSAVFLSLIRGVMGFGFGFLIPAASVLISKWFPLHEKSTAMAVYTTGNQIGIALGMSLTAKLSQVPLLGGWPLSWIIYGTLSGSMLIVWAFLAADKPRLSKFITAVELEHIGGIRARTNTVPVPTPYVKILMNPCVNAICLCSFAQSFVLIGLITYLPLFNQSAMKMHMSLNGLLSALPFCVQIIAKLLAGTAADRLKTHKISVTLVTKLFNGIASFGTAVVLVLIAFLDENSALVASMLVVLSMIFFSAYVGGYNTSIVSVVPMFTAFLSSYAQMYAQLGSSVAPVILAIVQGDDGDWSIVFYLFSAVLLISGLVFQIFGHGSSEKWAEPQDPADVNERLAMEVAPRSQRLSTRVSFRDDQQEAVS